MGSHVVSEKIVQKRGLASPLSSLRTTGSDHAKGNNRRILTSLFRDAFGDRRVNSTDLAGVRAKIGTSPIDPNQTSQVRSDVDNDDDIDQTV